MRVSRLRRGWLYGPRRECTAELYRGLLWRSCCTRGMRRTPSHTQKPAEIGWPKAATEFGAHDWEELGKVLEATMQATSWCVRGDAFATMTSRKAGGASSPSIGIVN